MPRCILTCQLIILELPYDETRVIFLVVNEDKRKVKGSCFHVQPDCNKSQLLSANLIEVKETSQIGEHQDRTFQQRKHILPSCSSENR